METKSPKLSIVMPVYNDASSVKKMIDSILANDYKDYELIIVDDGSEKDTLTMLNGYARSDVRIRIMQRERAPKGAPTCRNIGFDAASGEYIVFFDSDDYVTPDCLATRVKELDEHPELDFIVFRSGICHNDTFSIQPDMGIYGYPIWKDDLASFASRWLPFVVWNNIYRTGSLREKGIRWDEQLLSLQDADFNVATLVAGMTYAYSGAAPNYGYRRANASSVSRKIYGQEHFKSHEHSVRKMYTMVQGRYGHKYDRALLGGVYFLYNTLMSGAGVNGQLADTLATAISDLDPKGSRSLKTKARLSRLLEKILPPKAARQIPMITFLLAFRYTRRQKIKKLRKVSF